MALATLTSPYFFISLTKCIFISDQSAAQPYNAAGLGKSGLAPDFHVSRHSSRNQFPERQHLKTSATVVSGNMRLSRSAHQPLQAILAN